VPPDATEPPDVGVVDPPAVTAVPPELRAPPFAVEAPCPPPPQADAPKIKNETATQVNLAVDRDVVPLFCIAAPIKTHMANRIRWSVILTSATGTHLNPVRGNSEIGSSPKFIKGNALKGSAQSGVVAQVQEESVIFRTGKSRRLWLLFIFNPKNHGRYILMNFPSISHSSWQRAAHDHLPS
jgi:hypothetical protein